MSYFFESNTDVYTVDVLLHLTRISFATPTLVICYDFMISRELSTDPPTYSYVVNYVIRKPNKQKQNKTKQNASLKLNLRLDF